MLKKKLFLFCLSSPLSLSLFSALSLLHAKRATNKNTLSLPAVSLSTHCVQKTETNTRRKRRRKTLRFHLKSTLASGFCASSFASKAPRCARDPGDPQGPPWSFLHSLTSRSRGQRPIKVERGVDLRVVPGEVEGLERLQLAAEEWDGAEAARFKAEKSQRLHLRELCGERLVSGRVP